MAYDPNNVAPITITLSDLQRNSTIYEVRVQTRCAADNTLGEWSPSKSVVVEPQDPLIRCVTPGGVFMSNVTTNSATINWQPVASARSYIVEYRELGSPTFKRVEPVQGTSYTINNLNTGVQYVARVISRCSNDANDISYNSELMFFATSLVRDGAIATEAISNFSVYPNPNKGQFTLSFNAAEGGEAHISLTDLTGRVVYNRTYNAQAGNNEVAIELESFTSGVYMLQFTQGGVRQSVKVIIN